MKKKIVTITILTLMLLSSLVKMAHAQVLQKNSMIKSPVAQEQVKQALEICKKETGVVLPIKKGDKIDKEKMDKFRDCMHSKLAGEVNKLRQSK